VSLTFVQVKATDYDSGLNGIITYQLLEGQNSGYFYIGPSNGSLRVLDGLAIDTSIHSFFILTVMAEDGN
jgi:hypothetical protein